MASSQRSAIPDEELEQVAALVVRHLLFKQHSHPGVPVKREELSELVQKQHPHQRGLLPRVLPHAQHMCRHILGFDIVDMTAAAASGNQPSQSSQERSQSQSQAFTGAKFFLLRSRLDQAVLSSHVLKDDDVEPLAFRLVVCALIQGAGGSLPEETVWRLLGRMGVREDSTSHPAFGNVKDALQKMFKEKYIVARKGQAEDGTDTTCIELGAHALSEFGTKTLADYFATVCDQNNS